MKPSDFSRPALRVLAVSATALAVSATAYAHARPTSYEPAPNAEVTSPNQLTIHFSEPLEPAFSKITLSDASGKAAVANNAQVDATDTKAMHLALHPLAAGRYTVKWTAVATDGHRTHGTYAFDVK
jgi:methionine-rich copper-binding protein CopC